MDEEKKAAELAAAEAAAKATEDATAVLDAKDQEIAKLTEERDNYKTVALKRLGKLPGDAGFLEGADEKTGLTVEEQVKKTLLDREVAKALEGKDVETRRIAKENAELRLALKNRPGSSIGGDGGASTEVKDNVFSAEQIEALKVKALRLKADPVKFIENAKKNILARR